MTFSSSIMLRSLLAKSIPDSKSRSSLEIVLKLIGSPTVEYGNWLFLCCTSSESTGAGSPSVSIKAKSMPANAIVVA